MKIIMKGYILPIAFSGLLIFCVIAYFINENHSIGIIINHTGGLSIIGLFACLLAYIARKKGYSYRKIFIFALIIPVVVGLIAFVFFWIKSDIRYCGGGFSLLACLIIPIVILLLKKRP